MAVKKKITVKFMATEEDVQTIFCKLETDLHEEFYQELLQAVKDNKGYANLENRVAKVLIAYMKTTKAFDWKCKLQSWHIPEIDADVRAMQSLCDTWGHCSCACPECGCIGINVTENGPVCRDCGKELR